MSKLSVFFPVSNKPRELILVVKLMGEPRSNFRVFLQGRKST